MLSTNLARTIGLAVFMCALILVSLSLPGYAVDGGGEVRTLVERGAVESVEVVTYPERTTPEQVEAANRQSSYEVQEDDTTHVIHSYTALPFYSVFTFTGPDDTEWLNVDGNYSYHQFNANALTVYDVQGELSFSYRTRLFVTRYDHEIDFGVVSRLGNSADVDASVPYPARYDVNYISPFGYDLPAAGLIAWNFLSTTEYRLRARFTSLGGERPFLDLPVDYTGRGEGNIAGFETAFNSRITAVLDHHYPTGSQNGDNVFRPYTGALLTAADCPLGHLGFECYDGHRGYDFDDLCVPTSSCTNPSAVYPAAAGTIISARTGWSAVLGCTIIIDHGDGWTTHYSHLYDDPPTPGEHLCQGIWRSSGYVDSNQQIGIIGSSGSGANGTHLHFVLQHNGIIVDPSGWEPDPTIDPDPWAESEAGAASHHMWVYSGRTQRGVNPDMGAELLSPSQQVAVSIPAGYYPEQLVFNLSNMPTSPPHPLTSSGRSFSLSATTLNGLPVQFLNDFMQISVDFDPDQFAGKEPDDFSLYYLDNLNHKWTPLSTQVNFMTGTATAETKRLSPIALFVEKEIIYLPLLIED